ncbi:MAG: polysaccharide biosynthesis/export protein [Acidobacteriota bacterium]|nr:polysaccharide biosynthesis/export protein [Acidobacteriota bacterium]
MRIRTAKFATLALATFIALTTTAPLAALAQQPQPAKKDGKDKQTRQRTTQPAPSTAPQKPGERMEPDETSATVRTDVSPEMQAGRHEGLSEEEASVTPYYNNFMATYRLGPEDIISITVFGPYQDRYSKAGIVVPPNAVITHPLIPEGIFVGGKTTVQVQDEIRKKLDEYIADPKVTVTLDKAQSAVFWVVGDVGQPGIRPMTRRLSVTEALALAGGVLDTGNKSKVIINQRLPNGYMKQTYINVAAIEKGKQPDNFFLSPGDQVIVTGNRLKTIRTVMSMLPVVSFFRIFTGGF